MPSRRGWFWLVYFTLAVAGCEYALAHGQHFTDAENDWLNRQNAVDGTKCCDRHDTHVGENVTWRITGGQYEVRIGQTWHKVPEGRIMRHSAADPTPWPGEALLFYTPHSGGVNIWCFFPENLM